MWSEITISLKLYALYIFNQYQGLYSLNCKASYLSLKSVRIGDNRWQWEIGLLVVVPVKSAYLPTFSLFRITWYQVVNWPIPRHWEISLYTIMILGNKVIFVISGNRTTEVGKLFWYPDILWFLDINLVNLEIKPISRISLFTYIIKSNNWYLKIISIPWYIGNRLPDVVITYISWYR